MLRADLTQSQGNLRELVKLVGLLEASGVARWIFFTFLRISVCGPPPIIDKNRSRDVLGFFEFLYVTLRF